MSATGYEETDLSYHVPDDEDYEREENGEEEEDEESVRKPTESDARAIREESMRDLREDGCREVREQSASPPRDEEGNVRLQAGQHHVAENRGSAPDDERGGGVVPPVMTIPPHVLSQILSSPGFSLQVHTGLEFSILTSFSTAGPQPDLTRSRASDTSVSASTSSILSLPNLRPNISSQS